MHVFVVKPPSLQLFQKLLPPATPSHGKAVYVYTWRSQTGILFFKARFGDLADLS